MDNGALVRLRAPRPEDAESFYRWFNDPEATVGLGVRYPVTRQAERAWITAHAEPLEDRVRFAVETHEGRLLGTCGLFGISKENRSAELGVALMEKAEWGKGYGTDTVRTLCRYGFAELNLHRIELMVFAFHERAIKTYERVGFVREAVAREAHWGRGKYDDDVYMSLLEGELR